MESDYLYNSTIHSPFSRTQAPIGVATGLDNPSINLKTESLAALYFGGVMSDINENTDNVQVANPP